MPLLNVSSVLTDPDFADSFTVNRRMETVGTNGRTTIGSQLIPNILGVVTAISPSDLERQDGYESMTRSISVVTQFRLRGPAQDEQPDVIIWRGSHFVVKHVDPYPQFGVGFFQVECVSMDHIDPNLDAGAPGKMAFNIASNSVFLGVI